MKRVGTSLLVVVFANSYVSGAMVTFGPDITDAAPGATLQLPVTITDTTFDAFNSAGLVITSNEFDILGFSYSQDFIDATVIGQRNDPPVPFNPPRYPLGSELFIGGIAFLSNTMAAPLLVGTLTVGIPTVAGAINGTVFVSSELDGGASGLTKLGDDNPEGVFGSVNITPEPATLAFLAIGGLALLRRRRAG